MVFFSEVTSHTRTHAQSRAGGRGRGGGEGFSRLQRHSGKKIVKLVCVHRNRRPLWQNSTCDIDGVSCSDSWSVRCVVSWCHVFEHHVKMLIDFSCTSKKQHPTLMKFKEMLNLDSVKRPLEGEQQQERVNLTQEAVNVHNSVYSRSPGTSPVSTCFLTARSLFLAWSTPYNCAHAAVFRPDSSVNWRQLRGWEAPLAPALTHTHTHSHTYIHTRGPAKVESCRWTTWKLRPEPSLVKAAHRVWGRFGGTFGSWGHGVTWLPWKGCLSLCFDAHHSRPPWCI